MQKSKRMYRGIKTIKTIDLKKNLLNYEKHVKVDML